MLMISKLRSGRMRKPRFRGQMLTNKAKSLRKSFIGEIPTHRLKLHALMPTPQNAVHEGERIGMRDEEDLSAVQLDHIDGGFPKHVADSRSGIEKFELRKTPPEPLGHERAPLREDH